MKANYTVQYNEVVSRGRTKHVYSVGDCVFPSVTEILKIIGGDKMNALIGWAKKISVQMMNNALKGKIGESINITPEFLDWLSVEAKKEPQKKLEAAGDIGKRVHTAIDDYITGHLKEPLDKDVEIAFNSFLDWFKKNDFKFICGDLVVASMKYHYGGRLDALARRKNKIILLDWKTANNMRDEDPLQVALYAVALEETYSLRPSYAYVVRFGKDKPEVEEREVNLKEAMQAALRTVKLYNSFATKELFWKSEMENNHGRNIGLCGTGSLV